MKKLLYIDACVNRETSRTERLAQALLGRLAAEGDRELETLVLEDEKLEPLDAPTLNRRTAGVEAGDFSDPVFDQAKRFAAADEVVFAAPLTGKPDWYHQSTNPGTANQLSRYRV